MPGEALPPSVAGALERLYIRFAPYRCPPNVWVCEQCGPGLTAHGIASTPLRQCDGAVLEAVHATSAEPDVMRHFFARVVEVMLSGQGQALEFSLSSLHGRLTEWTAAERDSVREVLDAIWRELLTGYPARLGYFSDAASILNMAFWCDVPVQPLLDALRAAGTESAARHLGDLLDHLLTYREPFEQPLRAQISGWVRQGETGRQLRDAFIAATGGETARQLSDAFELWAACAHPGQP